MKHIVFLRAGARPEALVRQALDAFAAAPFGASVNEVQGVTPATPWHVVIEAWTDAPTLAAFLARHLAPELIAAHLTCAVDEFVEKDAGPPAGWPVDSVRLLAPWTRRPDVSPAECRRHWDEHVPLANRIHVGVTRYVRNWITRSEGHPLEQMPAYQGIASQHYPTLRDLQERSFDRPESVKVIEDDVADFLVDPVVLLVTEYRNRQRT